VSVQHALQFIRQYRDSDKTKTIIPKTFEDLVELAKENNLSFNEEDLKKAFKIDWSMRWLKHS